MRTKQSIWALLQDRQGYVWIGSTEGLSRFDGAGCTQYSQTQPPFLPASRVLALLESVDGAIWAGTSGGLARITNETTRAWDARSGLPSNIVWAVVEGSDGEVFAGTSRGLARIVGQRAEAVPVVAGAAQPEVNDLHVDPHGTLWAATSTGLVRRRSGVFEPAGSVLSKVPVRVIAGAPDGSILAGTDATVFALRGGQEVDLGKELGLPTNAYSAIATDSDNNLWLGTETLGLIRVRGRRFQTLKTLPGTGIKPIRSLLVDRERALWVGHFAGGLVQFSDSLITTFGEPEGLPVAYAWTVLEDSQGTIWIATYGGGLARLERDKLVVYGTKDGLPSHSVYSLAEQNGSILAGTDSGLVRVRSGRVTRIPLGVPDTPVRVYAILPTSPATAWLGTSRGLALLDKGKVTWEWGAERLAGTLVRALAIDATGTLWIGTFGEGICWVRDNQLQCPGSPWGRRGEIITSFRCEPDGTVWVCTAGGGLARYRDGRWATVTARQGLPVETIHAIVAHEGSYWMSSNRGIFQVRRDQLEAAADGRQTHVDVRAYGEGEGMRSAECNGGRQPAAWRTRSGRLLFASVAGIVTLDPNRTVRPLAPPPVRIERVLVDHQPLAGSMALSGMRNLELHYAALTFLGQDRVRYRYRLLGYHPVWEDVGGRRVAYFTNLPPGRYRFEVTACNRDGTWAAQPATFEFELRSPFWKTRTFSTVVVLGCTLFLAVAARRYHLRTLRRVRAELESDVAERTQSLEIATQQLELANKSLERLSEEDALTSLPNRRALMRCLEREWPRAARMQSPICLIMVGVDHFREYTDRLGRPAGDACLRAVAQAMVVTHRPDDMVARWGSEEFLAVLPDTPAEGGTTVAEHMREAVLALVIEHADTPAGRVTISCGVAASVPQPRSTPDTLITAADTALYQARSSGRNRVWVVS